MTTVGELATAGEEPHVPTAVTAALPADERGVRRPRRTWHGSAIDIRGRRIVVDHSRWAAAVIPPRRPPVPPH